MTAPNGRCSGLLHFHITFESIEARKIANHRTFRRAAINLLTEFCGLRTHPPIGLTWASLVYEEVCIDQNSMQFAQHQCGGGERFLPQPLNATALPRIAPVFEFLAPSPFGDDAG
jgi:hypothetical protein